MDENIKIIATNLTNSAIRQAEALGVKYNGVLVKTISKKEFDVVIKLEKKSG